ncbi:uncharacterized protein LOC134846719 [Symsagittifera roscoffensis]|uniref:uncharacterized protein LOC134846719 n=1 Tax=Symsagittifera roscoffensis TaxID=84072 RepID=UPI00307B6521
MIASSTGSTEASFAAFTTSALKRAVSAGFMLFVLGQVILSARGQHCQDNDDCKFYWFYGGEFCCFHNVCIEESCLSAALEFYLWRAIVPLMCFCCCIWSGVLFLAIMRRNRRNRDNMGVVHYMAEGGLMGASPAYYPPQNVQYPGISPPVTEGMLELPSYQPPLTQSLFISDPQQKPRTSDGTVEIK